MSSDDRFQSGGPSNVHAIQGEEEANLHEIFECAVFVPVGEVEHQSGDESDDSKSDDHEAEVDIRGVELIVPFEVKEQHEADDGPVEKRPVEEGDQRSEEVSDPVVVCGRIGDIDAEIVKDDVDEVDKKVETMRRQLET